MRFIKFHHVGIQSKRRAYLGTDNISRATLRVGS
jgi:hypothetical protein